MSDDRSYETYYMSDPSYVRSSRKRKVGVSFSKEEKKSLAIAVGVLTFCFAIAFTSNGIRDLLSSERSGEIFIDFIGMLPVSFLAVITAFVLHEVGHKIAANHFGFPAAFSYSKRGLLIAAFVSIFFGFLFAAPGAVYIYGAPSKKENGIISLAGPLTNLILGIIFFTLFIAFAVFSLIFEPSRFLVKVFALVAIINFFIGTINMFPMMPLDGAKIFKWSKIVYFLMLALLLPPTLILFLRIFI